MKSDQKPLNLAVKPTAKSGFVTPGMFFDKA